MAENDVATDSFDGCLIRFELNIGPRTGDPSEHVLHYEGDVLSGEGFDVPVGKVSAYVVDLAAAYDTDCHAIEVLDSVSSSLAHFCALISNRTGEFKRVVAKRAGIDLGRLPVLEHLEIGPEYRGRGLGLHAINTVCTRLGGDCVLAVLKAFPKQWEGRVDEGPAAFEADRAKLVKYYRRAQFVPILGDGLMARTEL